MADRDLQDRLVRPVINRERHLDLRNLDIAHDPGIADVQQPFILLQLLIRRRPAPAVVLQLLIICHCLLPHFLIIRIVDLSHRLHIGRDRLRLMKRIPVITDCGIQQ